MTCTTHVIRRITDQEPHGREPVTVRDEVCEDTATRYVIIEQETGDLVEMRLEHAVSVAVALNELIEEIELAAKAANE